MDGLCIAALIGCTMGLVGGILWDWGATRTAERVGFKIVTAANNSHATHGLSTLTGRSRTALLRMRSDSYAHGQRLR